MTNPFESGNREIRSEAVRNPINSAEDFAPTYSDQIGSAFDSAYYGVGIGIRREELIDVKEEFKKFKDLSFNDTIQMKDFYEMRFNGISEEKLIKRFSQEGVEYYDGLIRKNEQVKPPEQLKAENKARILGEVQTAESKLARGDSFTAQLAGGMLGAFTNPAVLGTAFMPVGAGIGLARSGSTVATILKTSAIEGAIGATTELASINLYKQNAAFLNKNISNWDLAQNAALAGAGGFLLTALGKSGMSAYKYIKETRKGVLKAENIVINKINPTADEQAAVRQMDDFSYTADRATGGDEFDPLYRENMTDKQYIKHMDDAEIARQEVFEWGKLEKTGNYDENLPKFANDVPPIVDDEAIYKELLTEQDRAFDAELFKKAEKLDVDIPVGARDGEFGEKIIDTRSIKELNKSLTNDISALSAISMCMRGAV